MADDEALLICHLVADLPVPNESRFGPAEMTECSECGMKVWRAQTSPKWPKVVCMPCTAMLVGDDDVTVEWARDAPRERPA